MDHVLLVNGLVNILVKYVATDVLYDANKCSMTFVTRIGYSVLRIGYSKLTDMTRNEAVRNFDFYCYRKLPLPTIHHKEASSDCPISLGSCRYYLEFPLTLLFSKMETFV